MNGVNKAIIVGNLGSDPEVRYTPSGHPVASFNVATTESWTKDGDKQEKTEWHRIVLWRKQAELAGKYLSKGSKVYIEGKLETRKWEDQNGQTRYTTEIIGQNVQFLDSKGNGGERQAPPPPSDDSAPSGGDDDLPF